MLPKNFSKYIIRRASFYFLILSNSSEIHLSFSIMTWICLVIYEPLFSRLFSDCVSILSFMRLATSLPISMTSCGARTFIPRKIFNPVISGSTTFLILDVSNISRLSSAYPDAAAFIKNEVTLLMFSEKNSLVLTNLGAIPSASFHYSFAPRINARVIIYME